MGAQDRAHKAATENKPIPPTNTNYTYYIYTMDAQDCKLSVNINKIALLRNARGGNNPNLVKTARDLELYGAQGITMHPRPDERHARYADAAALKAVLKVELNIEGYPDERWLNMVLACQPAQATLVPDAPDAITSSAGWDTTSAQQQAILAPAIARLKAAGIRVSLFVDPAPAMVAGAAALGADRVELYTEAYATHYSSDRAAAVAPYIAAAQAAAAHNLGLNAGHDLDLQNLAYLKTQLPNLIEVSIGHALIADALYYGLENVVRMYRDRLY